jgi:hypothetical protein
MRKAKQIGDSDASSSVYTAATAARMKGDAFARRVK